MSDVRDADTWSSSLVSSSGARKRAVRRGIDIFHEEEAEVLSEWPENIIRFPNEHRVEEDRSLSNAGYPYVLTWTYNRETSDLLMLQAARAGAADLYTRKQNIESDHLAVRVVPDRSTSRAPGYYVSRTYRALWFALLVIATVWGVISGISLATGSLFSPQAVLMGILGTIVLAATLYTAGSRDRIRRR